MEGQVLQTGQSRKSQGLCTGYPLCLQRPFPQMPAEPLIPSWGWAQTLASQTACLSLSISPSAEQLSVYSLPQIARWFQEVLAVSGSPFLKSQN